MSTELKNLRKQRIQAVKNLDYHRTFSRFSISEELAYYDSLQNLEEIEAQIIENKLIKNDNIKRKRKARFQGCDSI